MDIIKSKNDNRTYNYFILKNKLPVLIIHDPDTHISAAAMSVKVGFYNDTTINGLAHFLEHMLFMGTEKYPEVNYFMSFLNKGGGSTNAYTSGDLTNYFYDINNEYFIESLDIFGNFFIKPLFAEDATNKEINAVNEEYTKNYNSDMWRHNMIIRTMANPESSYHNFGCGNKKTLNVPNIRDKLVEFYNSNYSSNIMNLVVYTEKKMEQIKKIIKKIFINVPNKNLPSKIPYCKIKDVINNKEAKNKDEYKHKHKDEDNKNIKIFENLPISLKVVPMQDENKLFICWQTLPIGPDYKYKPLDYIINVLGHESDGTLVHYLKKNGYCEYLYVNVEESDIYMSLLTIEIGLTDYGFNKVDFIINLIYEYIDKIKREGINDWRYEEFRKVSVYLIDNMVKVDVLDYVENLANNLCRYPYYLCIICKIYFAKLSAKTRTIISKYLSYLSYDNMILVNSSKKHKDTKKIEKWYRIHYDVEQLDVTKQILQNQEKIILQLPYKNKYIPKNIKILAPDTKIKYLPGCCTYPKLINTTPFINVWFKQDNTFKTPYVVSHFILYNKYIYSSPKKYLAFLLYIEILNDELGTMATYCDYANSSFSISIHHKYIKITVKSYGEIIELILNQIIYNFFNLEITETNYEYAKDKLAKNIKNYIYDQLYITASTYFTSVVSNKFYTYDTLYEIIVNGEVTTNMVKKVKDYCKGNCICNCLIQGNITENQTKKYVENIEKFIGVDNINLNDFNVLPLANGTEELYKRLAINKNDKNSIALVFYEIGNNQNTYIKNWSFKLCKLTIIYDLIKEKFFHQLRSIEQLGYIINCNISNIDSDTNPLYCMKFMIQTTSKSPEYIHERIKKFIRLFYKELVEMQDSIIETSIKNIIINWSKPHDNLFSEAYANLKFILNGKDFDTNETLIKIIKKYKKSDIIKFFEKNFINKKTRRVRTLYVYGNKHTTI